MNVNTMLELPIRPTKPRRTGLTMAIDGGLPTGRFRDCLESQAAYIDYVKFGWGTALVSPNLKDKIEIAKASNVVFFLGGTLFEKFVQQGRIDDFIAYSRDVGADVVEISNGTLPMSNTEKTRYIERLAKDFSVISEVGYKDVTRSLELPPKRWIEFMEADFSAGADYVIAEARESGTSGVCRENGELRIGLIEEILDADLPMERVIFEAPNKALQVYFVKRMGPNVNLANVGFDDIISLETLRLGLRFDTFYIIEQADA